MFCKFVIKIRHLSIKIIYTSRTRKMIVLYNHINSNNPDQKPDCIPCFLSIYPRYPCKLSITCNLHFWTMCNLFPRGVLSLSRGVFYILILCTGCQILGMRSTHTSTTKSNTSNPNHSSPF